ncbi:MAG: TylF/MycF/NovP-related O-methyltransferase, partial [Dehalococcoidia bacterium]
MFVLRYSQLRGSGLTWWSEARYRVSLLAAACAWYSLYYRQLLGVYLRNLRLSRPDSLLGSLRIVRLVHSVRGYTAVLPLRLAALHRLSREIDTRSVPGDVVECGVYNGGSAALMASICTQSPLNRNMWLFDSFEGLPNPTDRD